MSVMQLEREMTRTKGYVQVQQLRRDVQRRSGAPLLTTWQRVDPVEDAISTLMMSGRDAEARVIAVTLMRARLDDEAAGVRALVSMQWADDWDSPEDSVYDEM